MVAAALAPAPASLYALLEVPQEASNEQVRQAFRTLSKRFHPDTTELPPELAAARFQALQEAMVVLGDPQKRRLYDASLKAAELNQQRLAQRFTWRPNTDPPPRRDLSGGEWFALVLLGVGFGFQLGAGCWIGLVAWGGSVAGSAAPALAGASGFPVAVEILLLKRQLLRDVFKISRWLHHRRVFG